MSYPANVKLIRVMCSGRVDPQFVMKSFREGADGVMVLGCHIGDCHYRNGNMKTLNRFKLFGKMIEQFGIQKERFRLDWIGAGEGKKFQSVVTKMTESVERIGPIAIKGAIESEVA